MAREYSLNLTLEFRNLGLRGWSGAGEQIFQHRANMHKTGDLTRKLDTERGEAGNGNFLSADYIFFFGVSCNFYFSHCFIVSRNASHADPVLGWKGGMRPVIKCSTPGEKF